MIAPGRASGPRPARAPGPAALLLALLAPVVAAAPGLGARGDAPDWPDVWQRLARLRSMAPADEGFAALASELQAIGRAERQDPRGRLLATQLLRLGPRPEPEAELQPPAADARPFEGVELWLAAEVLVPGPARARAVEQGLSWPGVGANEIRLAYDLGLEDAESLRLGDALVIQAALHRHELAAWSAGNLALTLRKLGRYDEADAVVEEQILRSTSTMPAGDPMDTAALWNDRGLLALGRNDPETARRHLGRALALGSDDAAVVLAVLDLSRGHVPEARAQFRALVARPRPGAWALRGFGLALLAGSESTRPAAPSAPSPPR